MRSFGLHWICLEIGFASVFFGAVHSWAWGILTFASFILLGMCWLHAISEAMEREEGPFHPFRMPSKLGGLLFLFSLSLLLSYWNFSSFEAPHAQALRPALEKLEVPWSVPSCLSEYHARMALYQWISPIITFLLIPYLLREPKDAFRLMWVLIVLGALQGVYGIVQHFSDQDPFPFFGRPDKEGKVGGTYICRNTYACFLAMVFPVTLCMIIHYSGRLRNSFDFSTFGRSRKIWVSSPHAGKLGLLCFCAIATVLGLFLSLSRGGVLAFLAGIGMFFTLEIFHHKHRFRKAYRTLWLALLTICAALYLHLIGMDALWDRFSSLPFRNGRWEIWRATLNILPDHWLYGVGGGNFFLAWEIYRPSSMTQFLWYAHNDYLQLLVEYGIISFVCGLIMLIAYVYYLSRGFACLPFPGALRYAAISSLLALFVHAFVDFSFNVPGHRLVCAVLMGMLLTKGR